MRNKYLVWCPEYDEGPEDGITIEAYDSADAAENWAAQADRRYPDDCFSIMGGESVEVIVQFVSTESQVPYRVSGESVPVYTAIRVLD